MTREKFGNIKTKRDTEIQVRIHVWRFYFCSVYVLNTFLCCPRISSKANTCDFAVDQDMIRLLTYSCNGTRMTGGREYM